ncbi:hypothetical protein [Microbacterium sp. zg-YB36]|uniref:hypothetical protein n=1 Tax=Microbacterium sp. zg-YB36 TaxID=2969407 RepID=UPI00214C3476|nr:hypothetical protein [Microbacterium sp. zg-YB36]MDL5350679.1 hypothetical protein [Microbacterium sp. zg-YB36]
MSEMYGSGSPTGTNAARGDASSKLDTAKGEASDLKDTAATKASDVAHTVKDEASTVIGEAGTQAKQLYAQTQREVQDQANAQRQRVASGLQSVSSELESMSANAENPGVGADLVRQVAGRLSGAASWLGDRDAAAVVTEVKRYARRKPGTFIIGAAIAGVVVGRLTRALAANASDAADARQSAPAAPAAARTAAPVVPSTPAPVVAAAETPLFDQSTTRGGALSGEGVRDVRSDTV